ncbi:MAG: SMR family transporter [Corynebacterium sp.]|uniref:DMT family transporter n=1 Tax=Corynebacterium sp. TaxID=1720 RepID=UPI0026DDA6A6|nr:SMR family transporter [Corynebacterium sp.]MDO5099863.1 SMR family transporter [Corynebacterium sp.]
MAWLYLSAAIILEVIATLNLKIATTRPRAYIIVAVGYIGAFAALSASLAAGMGIGVAYGLWTAFGVALTALLSRALFKETLTPTMIAGIGLIITGVVLVEFGVNH